MERDKKLLDKVIKESGIGDDVDKMLERWNFAEKEKDHKKISEVMMIDQHGRDIYIKTVELIDLIFNIGTQKEKLDYLLRCVSSLICSRLHPDGWNEILAMLDEHLSRTAAITKAAMMKRGEM